MSDDRRRILSDHLERRGRVTESGTQSSGQNAAAEAVIRRMSVEIEISGRRELVAVLEDERGIRAITTGGETGGEFVEAALEAFEAGRAKLTVMNKRDRYLNETPAPRDEEIAEAVRALVLAVARVGLGVGRVSPSVAHAFAVLEERIEGCGALGIERFIGRLRNAIEFEDLTECAMLLHGALRFIYDLEQGRSEARERIVGWMPCDARRITLNERGFVELGREWVAGLERAGIGRRYLIDLESGEIVREEFRAAERRAPRSGSRGGSLLATAGGSLGGSFRELSAGLATLSGGSAPRRIRFEQYELWHEPRDLAIKRLDDLAERSAIRLLERFKREHHAAPGQAEPFALFAPARIVSRGRATALIDERGDALPVSSAEGLDLDTALVAALRGARDGVRWVSGRLFHAEGALALRPFMVSIRGGETIRLR